MIKEVLERVMINWWQLLKEKREAFLRGIELQDTSALEYYSVFFPGPSIVV